MIYTHVISKGGKELELMKVDSVRELVLMITKDKSLEEEIRKDPVKAIAKITRYDFGRCWVFDISLIVWAVAPFTRSCSSLALGISNIYRSGKIYE